MPEVEYRFKDPKWNPVLLRRGSPEFDSFLLEGQNADTATLYKYWLSKCHGDLAPLRSDISPMDFVPLLPGVFLVEVVGSDPRDFVFRLVGTQVTDNLGANLAGKRLGEGYSDTQFWGLFFEHYREAAAGNVIIRIDVEAFDEAPHRYRVPVSVIVLPLRLDQASPRTGQLLGFIHYYRDSAERTPD